MTRKLLLIGAVLALVCLTGGVQATASATPDQHATVTSATSATSSAAGRHTATYTAKQRFKTRDNKTITGIRTGTGRVFTGVDKVTETIITTPVTMAPDSASALSWQRVGYVTDEATWTGSSDAYNYKLYLAASVGWQQTQGTNGPYYSYWGPFQYREQPACYRHLKSGGSDLGTSCNFAWYNSALEFKACAPYESCTIQAPWGFRDFYQSSAVAILFAGGWHNTGDLAGSTDGSVMSYTGDATARFLAPNHVTRMYCAGSFWYQPRYDIGGRDNYCSGLVAY